MFGSGGGGFGSGNTGFGTSTPFGSSNTQQQTTQSFGSTGSTSGPGTTGAFGSKPAFGTGSTTTEFGSTTTSAFGDISSMFRAPTTSTTSAFGTPILGTSTFGRTTSTSPFGAPAPAAGGGLFGSTTPATSLGAFGAGTSVFGASTQEGTGNPSWQETRADDPTEKSAVNLTSISAMKEYEGKSYEELRVEDYLQNRKDSSTVSTNYLHGNYSTPFSGSNAQQQTTPAFGSACIAFGSGTTGAFDSKPVFGTGSTTTGFGSTTTSAFGAKSSMFGGKSSMFGAPTTSIRSAFGTLAPKILTFGRTTSTSPFGAPAPAAGGGLFGSTTPATSLGAFGAGTSVFEASTQKGTGNPSWQETRADDRTEKSAVNLMSISAMKEYEGKSHEELRIEDYLQNRKNGSTVSTAGMGFGTTRAQSTGLFGGFESTPSAAPAGEGFSFGRLFGGGLVSSTTPAPAAGGFAGFGATPAPAHSTGLFGAPAPATTNAFGVPAPAPSGSFSFGATATSGSFSFGATAPAPSGDFSRLFGSSSASPAPGPGTFGAPAPAAGTFTFGTGFGSTGATPAPDPGGFGSSFGAFGAPAPAPATATDTSPPSLFVRR